MNEKTNAIRDARQLGLPKMLLLGLQHMFAMFGATILVPILVSSYYGDVSQGRLIQVTLFCAGIGTLFFHLMAKLKVPAFLGSSFAFLGGFATVANFNDGKYAGMSGDDKLAYACGGIVIAGLLYLILALIIKLVGVKKVMRFLPPVVTGPIIICIGLNPCRICNRQCFDELAACAGCSCDNHYFQYMGKRNVENYSNSYGCCHFLCGCMHFYRMRHS